MNVIDKLDARELKSDLPSSGLATPSRYTSALPRETRNAFRFSKV